MSELPFAATAPVWVSKVGLKARDARNLAKYYEEVVGLVQMGHSDHAILLGAGGRGLLEIEGVPDARPDDPRSAGLFHTAFLLPSRQDLARWVKHAAANRIKVDGASDHLVSEALYLTDPERNGIEIYADRKPEDWKRTGAAIDMATLPLDTQNLLATIDGDTQEWSRAPDNSIVGHVHLRVGDPQEAERWWVSEMGFETMARYGDAAVFLATGGYHHHIGANSWRSARAGRREPDRTGLAWVELASRDAEGEKARHDPWGTEIRTVPAPA